LFSCGEDKLQISSKEKLAKVKQLAVKQFGADLEIHKLDIPSNEDLSNNLGDITI